MESSYATDQLKKRQEELFVKNLSHVIEEYGLNTHYSPDSLAIFCLQSINSLNQVTEGHNLRMAQIPKQEPEQDKFPIPSEVFYRNSSGEVVPVEPRNIPGDCIRG